MPTCWPQLALLRGVRKAVYRVNPTSSHDKEKNFFPFLSSSFHGIYTRGWMLAEPTVVIISHQTTVLHTLNLHSGVNQLLCNKTGIYRFWICNMAVTETIYLISNQIWFFTNFTNYIKLGHKHCSLLPCCLQKRQYVLRGTSLSMGMFIISLTILLLPDMSCFQVFLI